MNHFNFLLSMPGGIEWIFVIVFGLLATLYWLKALLEVANRQFQHPESKIIWLAIVFFFFFAGALFWWAWGPRVKKVS